MYKNFLLIILLIPVLGFAQRVDNTASFRNFESKRYFRINYDNDYFSATDRFYTQGINLELVNPWLKRNPLNLMLPALKNSYVKYGLTLDHVAFSPTSIRHEEIIEGDRPFAAIISLKSFQMSIDTQSKSILSSSIAFGMIGPSAFGEGMQKTIHTAIGDIQPLGWQNQIANDVAITYELNHEKQLFGLMPIFVLNTDAHLRLGTLNNNLRAGINFSLGKLNNPFDESSHPKFQCYVYNQSFINFIGYDASLQGGMMNRMSPYTISYKDISRITFQENFGVVIKLRKLYLEYFQSLLSKEFETGKQHRWGGVKIGFSI